MLFIKECTLILEEKEQESFFWILVKLSQVLIKNISLGNHKNDQLNGQCIVFLDWSCYFIGNFVRGMLDGQFVIRNKSMTIYSNINMNKIDGEILVISY